MRPFFLKNGKIPEILDAGNNMAPARKGVNA